LTRGLFLLLLSPHFFLWCSSPSSQRMWKVGPLWRVCVCVTSTVKYWEAMGSRIPKAPWTLTSLSYKPPPSQNRDNY
jgi:hypothetical protein